MYKIVASNQFKKDLKLAKKRGLDLGLLRSVVNTLADGKQLEDKHRDHSLTGEYSSFRECHIEPDWLLIYRIENKDLELFLFRKCQHDIAHKPPRGSIIKHSHPHLYSKSLFSQITYIFSLCSL